MHIFLSFVGTNDPFSTKETGRKGQGPILRLLEELKPDRAVFFCTPSLQSRCAELGSVVRDLHPSIGLEIVPSGLEDPTDHAAIMRFLITHVQKVRRAHPDAVLTASVTSGTPAMHACWLYVSSAPELRLRLVHIREQRFVTADRPHIQEIRWDPGRLTVQSADTMAFIPSGGAIVPDPFAVALECSIIGEHPSLRECIRLAARYAASGSLPVLLTGESGTGKELFARFIVRMSTRNGKPLLPVNTATLSGQTANSELFGYKKGAFTGAERDKDGIFQTADGGTLFLDEIADLPLDTQASLLRAIEYGEVRPVGATEVQTVDVRILAATNKDLESLVEEGKFRQDLFERLNVGTLVLPPLRERASDIPFIADALLARINRNGGKNKRITPAAMTLLSEASWAGSNVRGLKNAIERAWHVSEGDEIDTVHLDIPEGKRRASEGLLKPLGPGFRMEDQLNAVRDHYYHLALEKSGGNCSEAARMLGLTAEAVRQWKSRRAAG
ncbi:MAG: sigma-54 dependent transcriptional regulator [Bacteroidota bacterium]|nr:sigma-54 dependent transcriptional regulator [Bacteroidota bacterium]